MTAITKTTSESESDFLSCEATLRSCKESPDKNSEVSTRLGPIDLHDTDAMLYQLSYEASLKAGQERVQFYTHYMKSEMMCIFNHVHTLQIKNTVLHSCEA